MYTFISTVVVYRAHNNNHKPNIKHSDGSVAAGENESCPDRGS